MDGKLRDSRTTGILTQDGFDNLEEGEEYTNDAYRIAGRRRHPRESRRLDPVKAEQGVKREIGIYIGQAAEAVRLQIGLTRLYVQTVSSPLALSLPLLHLVAMGLMALFDPPLAFGHAPRYDTTSELYSGSDSTGVSNPADFLRLSSVPISEGPGRSQENIPNSVDLGLGSQDDPFVISDSDGSDIT
ncbi:uncharacterized protein FMAN_12866 [Fusarium mangiferae]|uniref:Uncharacterized protein n=1 Tax=Fusarium mangiferae TaxID=192010 RepID=A0A1L7UBB7_FUSMA|nr:uncharacterized protein FMAN_12866 [Fusarium mangiferae]CVL04791.1 uncharacterized protein FMAN_12866 [Fusarium mangiferae]